MTKEQTINNIDALIERQNNLEAEINQLKDYIKRMKKENENELQSVIKKTKELEDEITEVRKQLNELLNKINSLHDGMENVEKHVTEINTKQDNTIVAQDKFISQLWKAFFILLGVLTTAGSAIFALTK